MTAFSLASGVAVTTATLADGGAFSPQSLFANGEIGAWYDPSDLSTLYQDHAGTTPVTAVDQTVALMLDKSRGLVRGPELVTNGTFTTDTSGWTGNLGAISAVGGVMRLVGAGDFPSGRQSFAVTAGVAYEVTGRLRSVSGSPAVMIVRPQGYDISAGGISIGQSTSSTFTTFRGIVFATTGTLYVRATINEAASTGTVEFDDISIKALPGLHVGQTTAGSRPALKRDASGRYLLRFDGTDDGIFTPYLPAGQAFPFTMICAAKANADVLGGIFGAWGGAPPYYEIQKSVTANQWRAFDRGAVNYTNVEVGATANPHVLTMEMATTTVNLRIDGTDPTAATTQDNVIGAITDIRIGNGGGGFFNGDFYGGVIRFGTWTAAQLSSTERFMATKSGATVP